MKPSQFLLALTIVIIGILFGCKEQESQPKNVDLPNIIFILADDLGYGDLSCLNPDSKIQTKNLDALADQGMIFTDAHSNSAVCTPTRYGLLTGRYAWRTRLKEGVLWGYDQPLIEPGRMTAASLLKNAQYHSACIGKWHLGLRWAKDSTGNIDITQPVNDGPLEAGFDYFFGIPASLDMPPYVYIQNDLITAQTIDTVPASPGKAFWREGPVGDDFKHEEVLSKLTGKAVEYINRQAKKDGPFFLYFPLTAPHTPIIPTDDYLGKSGTNAYGDFVLMVDDAVAEITDALKENGIENNTLVIFASDNGCSPRADFEELSEAGHAPSYHFRGAKADIFEGGHRIPFLIRWPSQVKPGSQSNRTISLTDFLATVAAITGQVLPDDAGVDSFNLLPIFLNDENHQSIQEVRIHHSINGSFAIRKGLWKLIFCPGSGGWSHPLPQVALKQGLPPFQLYDLTTDISESQNLVSEYPEIVTDLTGLMRENITNGRSTPGNPQPNDRGIPPGYPFK